MPARVTLCCPTSTYRSPAINNSPAMSGTLLGVWFTVDLPRCGQQKFQSSAQCTGRVRVLSLVRVIPRQPGCKRARSLFGSLKNGLRALYRPASHSMGNAESFPVLRGWEVGWRRSGRMAPGRRCARLVPLMLSFLVTARRFRARQPASGCAGGLLPESSLFFTPVSCTPRCIGRQRTRP